MFQRMIYEENLAAASYLIGCQRSGEAIVIDPLRDIDRYINLANSQGLTITAVTETHIHADFLSGCRELAEALGAKLYLSDEGGKDWRYGWLSKKSSQGSYEHTLLKDGDTFFVGEIEFKVVHTPGHTPEHICFLITDRGQGVDQPMAIASGDFIFVGDLGRPDLLESAAGKLGAADASAHTLYQSITKMKKLPEFLQVWPAHGAGSACGKALGAVPCSTIGYELRFNPAIQAASSEDEFVNYILAGQPEPPLYFARMKSQNRDGMKVLGDLPKPDLLNVDKLRSLDTKKSILIDTRPWNEFREGHIANSLSHPLNRSFVNDVGSFVGEDPEIYLIAEEWQIEDAVRNLVRIGLDRILGWFPPQIVLEYQEAGGQLATTAEQSAEETISKVQSRELSVLDVRRASEYSEMHIPGAKQIALSRLASELNAIPKEKPLLVQCASGYRSARACALLQRAGFEVTNLAGGIWGWKEAGGDLE